MSFEVDFDYFVSQFFQPRIQAWCSIKPIVVWTEICSYIKGHSTAHKYMGRYLPKSSYLNLGKKVSLLSSTQKDEVYDIFIKYERWKFAQGAYDFMDVVNYIINQVNWYGYSG